MGGDSWGFKGLVQEISRSTRRHPSDEIHDSVFEIVLASVISVAGENSRIDEGRSHAGERRLFGGSGVEPSKIVPPLVEVGIDEIFAGCVNGPVCLYSAIDLFYLE